MGMPPIKTYQVDGAELERIRALAGLSRTALAKRAGISYFYVRKIEIGESNPGVELFHALCNALEIADGEDRDRLVIAKGVTRATGRAA